MLVVVNHHYIRPDFAAPFPSIFGLTPKQFRAKLIELGKWGTFISQRQLVDHLIDLDSLPERSILITFDDGLTEQFMHALPILDALEIPAVFYVSTATLREEKLLPVHKIHLLRAQIPPLQLLQDIQKFIQEQQLLVDQNEVRQAGIAHYKYDTADAAELKYLLNFELDSIQQAKLVEQLFVQHFPDQEANFHDRLYLDEGQIRSLGQRGYLGSHGHDHLPLGLLSLAEMRYQAHHSKAVLEAVSGQKINGFSYPYGAYSACLGGAEILSECGYKYGLTMERASNDHFEQPYYLSRFDNNDLPLGKSYDYDSNDFFRELPTQNWSFKSSKHESPAHHGE